MWLIIAMFVLIPILYRRSMTKEYKKLKYYFKTFVLNALIILTPLTKLHLMLTKGKHYSNTLLIGDALSHISKLYGIKWRLRNGEILAEDRGAVIISNHQSSFDVIGACHAFDIAGKVIMVAKKSIMYTGPLGLATYLSETVFVDRSSPQAAYKTLKSSIQMITKQKVKIWFYPEGTRNVNKTKKMLPFKKGAFLTAVATQAPIIPVVYSPYYFVDKKKYVFDQGNAIMQCLDPVPTAGLTLDDVPVLMDRLREIMLLAYDKLAMEVTNLPTENNRNTEHY